MRELGRLKVERKRMDIHDESTVQSRVAFVQ